MKARELPETPNEHTELLHEITEIATEARDQDPHTHFVSSHFATMKRHVVGLLSLVSRAKSSLFAHKETPQRAVGGGGAAGRAGR